MAGTGAQADPAHKGILMPSVERVQGFVRSTAVLVRRLPDIEMHLQLYAKAYIYRLRGVNKYTRAR